VTDGPRTRSNLREALASLEPIASRLTDLSRRHYHNPYATVWPESIAPESAWCTSPELTTLYGTPRWDRMTVPARRRLAFHEAANFFSLNIHGEAALMAGLAARLARRDLESITEYLHHFLDEENKHSVYFSGFCRRYACIYRSRQLAFPGSPFSTEQEDFIFFAKTMIFEEIVDHYNFRLGRDPRLHPTARFINEYHHAEEARHLVFGRRLVSVMWAACAPAWGQDARQSIRDYLGAFVTMAWREYYNPDVYADCGFDDPWEVAESAWQDPAQRAHRRAATRRCFRVLRSADIFDRDESDAF
jgi:hypothetical protein